MVRRYVLQYATSGVPALYSGDADHDHRLPAIGGAVKVTSDLAFVPFALLGAIAGLALFQRLTNKQFQVA